MPGSSAQTLAQAGRPLIRASITTAPSATRATWTRGNAQRAQPVRRAGPAGGGNRSASTPRTLWPAVGGRNSPDPAWPGARRSRANITGTYHQPARAAVQAGRPLALDGSDPAVGPGPVGIGPWITAVGPPVGDQDQPGIDQLAPVEHAQDRVLTAGNEHGTAAFGDLSVRAHLLRRALIGGMRDDQVASWRERRQVPGHDAGRVVGTGDVVQAPDEQQPYRPVEVEHFPGPGQDLVHVAQVGPDNGGGLVRGHQRLC